MDLKKSRNIFLIGGYGVGNIGDEAILSGILKRFRKINPKLHFCSIANRPSEVKKIHNISAVKVLSFKFFRMLFNSDTIVIGGGTIFRKKMRIIAQLIPLVALFFSIFTKKKVIFYSLGIDKNTSFIAKLFLVPSMNLSNFISVRDNDSMLILKKWGIKKEINLIEDPSLNLDYKKFPRTSDIGISLRCINQNTTKKFAFFLDRLIEEKKCKVVFFPFSRHFFNPAENDFIFAKKIRNEMKNKDKFKIFNKKNPYDVMSEISKMKFVIAMRLHSMIFAYRTKTPMIPISYSQKCDSFLKSINLEAINIKKIDFDELLKICLSK